MLYTMMQEFIGAIGGQFDCTMINEAPHPTMEGEGAAEVVGGEISAV